MRRWLIPAVVLLAVELAFFALFDFGFPFLPTSRGLTWWVDPEPLSTMHGDVEYERLFSFVPERSGVVTFSGSLRCAQGDRRRVQWPRAYRNELITWRFEPGVRVDLSCTCPRLLPALGLSGDGAPSAVEVAVPHGTPVAAVRAGALLEPRPLRNPRVTFLLRGSLSCLVPFLLVAFVASFRAPLAPARAREPVAAGRDARPWILGLATALALFNLARYPVERGLDAESHVTVARIVATEHRIPEPTESFVAYHPPLYPVLGGLALRLTGSTHALQALTTLFGLGLVALAAWVLGPSRPRGLVLLAFLPVLLLTEPQATNETLVALLVSAALVAAARCARRTHHAEYELFPAGLAGLLVGLALLAKYTGVFALAGALAAVLIPAATEAGTGPPSRQRRVAQALVLVAVAIVVGSWPYAERAIRYGDPFIGNWDDRLGFPYRQPPGFRIGAYFTRFGAALLAHPFEARKASLWDSLYVSWFGDGFGRFITTPLQHALLLVLAWLALPLALTVLRGFLAIALGRGWPSRLETASVAVTVLMVAAIVRFNLELPYWSTAKGVFLLALALPMALFFERGADEIDSRLGRWARRALDLDLALFAVTSAATFVYR